MPHVELSFVDASRRVPHTRAPLGHAEDTPASYAEGGTQTSYAEGGSPTGYAEDTPAGFAEEAAEALARWATVVTGATEPCLVIDVESTIVAASPACAEMIGLGEVATARGRQLRDAVAELVDFTDSLDRLDSAEADKIPPLLAISSGRLARGLMRVVCPITGRVSTMDAIATPLWGGPRLAGSLSFFSRV